MGLKFYKISLFICHSKDIKEIIKEWHRILNTIYNLIW